MLVNLLFFPLLGTLQPGMVTVGMMQHCLWGFHHWMKAVGIAAWVLLALKFRVHHFQDPHYKQMVPDLISQDSVLLLLVILFLCKGTECLVALLRCKLGWISAEVNSGSSSISGAVTRICWLDYIILFIWYSTRITMLLRCFTYYNEKIK